MSKPPHQRSPHWPNLRRQHLARQPMCQVCGAVANLEVHHLRPVHLAPELELDQDNLLTLCEGPGVNCHLLFGHCNDWRAYNPNCLADVAFWQAKIAGRAFQLTSIDLRYAVYTNADRHRLLAAFADRGEACAYLHQQAPITGVVWDRLKSEAVRLDSRPV